MNVFVFDIETIPDVAGGRRIHDLEGLSDKDVANVMFHQRMEKAGTEFLRHHLHRVVAISVVLRHGKGVNVWSLGDVDADEKEILSRFFSGIEKYTPTLVTWNGGGFDLPVIHYRTLVHGIPAPRYWEMGDEDRDFRWNNYISRYHFRHIDLMDLLSGYQPRAVAPLDDIATLLGFPGKMGMDGSKVWDSYQAGDIQGIRDYCETDVLNTYLVYLRFELMRGRLTRESYDRETELLRTHLSEADRPHFVEFLNNWHEDLV